MQRCRADLRDPRCLLGYDKLAFETGLWTQEEVRRWQEGVACLEK